MGEWQRFAAETKVARGGELYALICWAQGQVEGYPQLFSVHGIAWADVKAGYAEMLRRSSRSPWVQNCMARLALDAGDRETAARMFEEIGADYYSSAWKSRAMFEDYRVKALGVRAGDTILRAWFLCACPGCRVARSMHRRGNKSFRDLRREWSWRHGLRGAEASGGSSPG